MNKYDKCQQVVRYIRHGLRRYGYMGYRQYMKGYNMSYLNRPMDQQYPCTTMHRLYVDVCNWAVGAKGKRLGRMPQVCVECPLRTVVLERDLVKNEDHA